MSTQRPHIEANLPGVNSTQYLVKSWMRWALFFFFAASVFGLMMRYYFLGEIPFFAYKNLLHTHSHIALLGWGYMLIMGYYVFSFGSDQKRAGLYKKMLTINVVAGLGMLASFPIQGYGAVSIFFSTIQLLSSYYFSVQILRDLKKAPSSTAVRMIRFSIYWMLLSTLGLLAIGPVSVLLGRNHPLYFMSVQWFLHLQLSGWFTYAVFGVLMHYLEEKGKTIHLSKTQEWTLHLSVLLTYALSVSWSTPMPFLSPTNSLGVVMQSLAYFWILRPLISALFPGLGFPSHWVDRLMYLGVLSLIAKALVMALLAVPSVAHISITIRLFVIGFIHLVMLGTVSLGIGAVMVRKGWLPIDKLSKKGWTLLIWAFVLTETLLFIQGLLLWVEVGYLPQYHLIVFSASVLFPVSLAVLLYTAFRSPLGETITPIQSKSNFNIQTKNQSMKSSVILSIGIAAFLLTSCGGGSNQGTYTPPSAAPAAEKVADPKGIGEIKSVEIGEGIDEALANKGKAIVDMKCTACHQLNDKRLVGPGFQGVTNRRKPEWIMNMITNVDVMLDQDPTAQALLEECLTRMPNQNISVGDARDILEFFRKNDLEKAGSKDGAL